jgi:hypothetical protein
MLLKDLTFWPCEMEGTEFAVLYRHRVTVWRHRDGTYSVRVWQKGDSRKWFHLELVAAQGVLTLLTKDDRPSWGR